jgi:hypothetical protein
MRHFRVSTLVTLFFVLIPTAPSISYADSQRPRRSLFEAESQFQREEVLPLAERRDFKALEALAERYRQNHERTAWGGFKLQLFYDALRLGPYPFDVNNPPEHTAFLNDWRKAFPSSHIPKVLEAIQIAVRGFNAQDETNERKAFQKFEQQAWDLLKPLASKNIPDPHIYATMLFAAKGLELPKDQLFKIYRQGMKLEPVYTHLHFRMIEKFLPKWGGTPENCVEVIDLAASTVGAAINAEEGDWIYFKLAAVIAVGEWDESKIILDKLSRERIWRGYDVSERRYPGYTITLHQRAMIAYFMEDWPLAKTAFAEAQNVWDRDAQSIWRNREFFEKRRLKLVLGQSQ